VSRLSIPPETGRENVSLDLDLPLEASDQALRLRPDGDEFRHGLPVLRNDDPLGVDAVQKSKAPFLEP